MKILCVFILVWGWVGEKEGVEIEREMERWRMKVGEREIEIMDS